MSKDTIVGALHMSEDVVREVLHMPEDTVDVLHISADVVESRGHCVHCRR
jgi:hypothetical protein